MQFPTLPMQLRLSTAVKAVNDTAGPDGLFPSLLLFGSMPFIPQTGPEDERLLPKISVCKEALCLARREYADLIARHRVQNVLNRKVPSAAHKLYTPGQQLYVYRERKKRWEGPFTVIKVQPQRVSCWMLVGNSNNNTLMQFRSNQQKPQYKMAL